MGALCANKSIINYISLSRFKLGQVELLINRIKNGKIHLGNSKDLLYN